MKRKRSLDEPALMSARKRAPMGAPAASATGTAAAKAKAPKNATPCPLIQILREYGLLEAIISSLVPTDLLALALSCKATYEALFPSTTSLDNLLSRMPCCGSGIILRRQMHHKSTFFYAYECTEFAQCGTLSVQHIESRPCISCKVTTCDECRIHCVYQSIYETPSDPEDLPNFSGFVLLDPFEVAILSPDHLPSDPAPASTIQLPQWRNRAADPSAGPYHDQGFLDMPLEVDQPGNPEKISDVLDVDLGLHSLTTWSGNSQFGFPSPVLRTLCSVAEQRKLFLCGPCSEDALQGPKAVEPALPRLPWLDSKSGSLTSRAPKECHCSLRSRILDRWQCVKCYDSEQSTINAIYSSAPGPQCRCGALACKTVCMWCWGEVAEERARYQPTRVEEITHTTPV